MKLDKKRVAIFVAAVLTVIFTIVALGIRKGKGADIPDKA